MILSGQLKILVYADAVASNNPQKRIVDMTESLADSSVAQWQTLQLQIPDLTVDQAINLNGITADKLYIKSSQAISIKINGSLSALAGNLFYMQCAVTSLTISNASGAVAAVEIGLGA